MYPSPVEHSAHSMSLATRSYYSSSSRSIRPWGETVKRMPSDRFYVALRQRKPQHVLLYVLQKKARSLIHDEPTARAGGQEGVAEIVEPLALCASSADIVESKMTSPHAVASKTKKTKELSQPFAVSLGVCCRVVSIHS